MSIIVGAEKSEKKESVKAPAAPVKEPAKKTTKKGKD